MIYQVMFSLWFLQYSTQCVSGCMCPNDLVSDGKGGCVTVQDCPCVHNEASYNSGETIKVNCNTWYVYVEEYVEEVFIVLKGDRYRSMLLKL